MNLKNILWVRNTGKIMPSASVQENLFGLKLSGGGGGVITTATGNPVSIVTNKAQNAIDLQIAFSPKQSGSGTPSPDNIRPLVPWTALTLTKNGVDTSYSLGSSYYGGSLDVVTGELTVTHAIVDLGTLNFARTTSYRNPVIYSSILDRKIGSTVYLTMCDTYFTIQFAYGSAETFANNASDLQCACSRNNAQVYFRDDFYTSASDFKTAMNGHYIVYELATPITVTLTPAEVALLAGNNTLATDGDSLTVTYMAKK